MRRSVLVTVICVAAVACSVEPESSAVSTGAGGTGGSSSATTGGGASGSSVASGGGSGGASSSTGGGGAEPCLDINVIAEGSGGGIPVGPCEVDLTGLLTDVDLDTLAASIVFFNAPNVALGRVQGVSACGQNAAAYYLEQEVFKLCPATCDLMEQSVFQQITITGDCAP